VATAGGASVPIELVESAEAFEVAGDVVLPAPAPDAPVDDAPQPADKRIIVTKEVTRANPIIQPE
jgi:hypothetical protein